MRSNLASAITVVLFASFVYYGWQAGWWYVMRTWTPNTWAAFFLGCLVAWIGRNEFGGGGGGH